ncbi:hypothetical protein [Corynebacterium uterequi]|uniref:Uncharacterized protein n=1 Tax=Corynebacterium uterequi TaxID=1072256 RepID=A0A0G3HFX5_9CORY|nr:hypothetical protein [Corynebacterium uterequi]AKK10067.1 hypothetical protein CUTER_00185 [Corynebacterium uterequi]
MRVARQANETEQVKVVEITAINWGRTTKTLMQHRFSRRRTLLAALSATAVCATSCISDPTFQVDAPMPGSADGQDMAGDPSEMWHENPDSLRVELWKDANTSIGYLQQRGGGFLSIPSRSALESGIAYDGITPLMYQLTYALSMFDPETRVLAARDIVQARKLATSPSVRPAGDDARATEELKDAYSTVPEALTYKLLGYPSQTFTDDEIVEVDSDVVKPNSEFDSIVANSGIYFPTDEETNGRTVDVFGPGSHYGTFEITEVISGNEIVGRPLDEAELPAHQKEKLDSVQRRNDDEVTIFLGGVLAPDDLRNFRRPECGAQRARDFIWDFLEDSDYKVEVYAYQDNPVILGNGGLFGFVFHDGTHDMPLAEPSATTDEKATTTRKTGAANFDATLNGEESVGISSVDVGTDTDRFLNMEIISGGYAYSWTSNHAAQTPFHDMGAMLENAAATAGDGIWGHCADINYLRKSDAGWAFNSYRHLLTLDVFAEEAKHSREVATSTPANTRQDIPELTLPLAELPQPGV